LPDELDDNQRVPEPVTADFSARIQLIVDVLAQTVGRAVLLDDEDLHPITHSRQLGELDDVRVHSVLQRETRAEVKADLFGVGIGAATTAMWTPAFPQHGLVPRYCVPVRSATERFGYLWILDRDGALPAEGQRLAEQAGADLLAILDRRNATLRAEESAQQTLLMRLLTAATGDQSEQVVRELQARDMAQPDSTVTVFVFESYAPGAGDPVDHTMALRLRLAATDRSRQWFTVAGNPTTVLAVTRRTNGSHPALSLGTADATVDTVADGIAASYGIRPAIGASTERLPISHAAVALRQARTALRLGQIGASDQQITAWSKLGSWRTLALLAEAYGPDRLIELIHPGIVGLIDGHRDDLIHTLEVYLGTGGDARRTAEELYLHRSTLYYRLEKLTEAIGSDLGDAEIRFELMLGIRLARFAGLYRSHAPGGGRPTAV
jgi:sugar diacid utilization regulator